VSEEQPELLAYGIGDTTAMTIEPGPVRRQWMDDTPGRFANRCLPMLLANQHGWWLCTRRRVAAIWYGGHGPETLEVEGGGNIAVSHFGDGILTWHIPWLFRTSPGWNLWVRGPSNWFLSNAYALEGIVETDWTVATFTMNWLFVEPEHEVLWEPGDPIAMLVPVPRGQVEAIVPRFADPPTETARGYHRWESSRSDFNQRLRADEPGAIAEGWQRDYFLGDGEHEHQRRLTLRKFQ